METSEHVNINRLLVGRREAAHILSVSERTLFDLTRDGVVPCIRLGDRTVRYSIKALEERVDQLHAAATSTT